MWCSTMQCMRKLSSLPTHSFLLQLSLYFYRLIGINYVGQQGQLSGCHNDVGNIKKYLIKQHNFLESEMLILMDDGQHHQPTKRNIEDAFSRITQYSKAGDVVFVHYSGHGGKVVDTSGDEVRGDHSAGILYAKE
jgi:hypothetical protein